MDHCEGRGYTTSPTCGTGDRGAGEAQYYRGPRRGEGGFARSACLRREEAERIVIAVADRNLGIPCAEAGLLCSALSKVVCPLLDRVLNLAPVEVVVLHPWLLLPCPRQDGLPGRRGCRGVLGLKLLVKLSPQQTVRNGPLRIWAPHPPLNLAAMKCHRAQLRDPHPQLGRELHACWRRVIVWRVSLRWRRGGALGEDEAQDPGAARRRVRLAQAALQQHVNVAAHRRGGGRQGRRGRRLSRAVAEAEEADD